MNKLSHFTNVLKKTFFPSERRRAQAEKAVGAFTSACCDQAESAVRTSFNEVYEAYLKWFAETSSGSPLHKKAFFVLICRRFPVERVGGAVRLRGVKLSPVYMPS